MMKSKIFSIAAIAVLGVSILPASAANAPAKPALVCDVYPGLASNSLTYARLGDLPSGVIFKTDGLMIQDTDIAGEIAKVPTEMQAQIKKNAFFVLENLATRQLLLSLAKDNPVDTARASGKPSLVDFGSTGCRPCDILAPILDALEEKYAGKLNVVFVHVGQEQILASRYGIQSIPMQFLYDKDGTEVFRHTGFGPQVEIEKKLAEMGVTP